jgi:hypothetical protein
MSFTRGAPFSWPLVCARAGKLALKTAIVTKVATANPRLNDFIGILGRTGRQTVYG